MLEGIPDFGEVILPAAAADIREERGRPCERRRAEHWLRRSWAC